MGIVDKLSAAEVVWRTPGKGGRGGYFEIPLLADPGGDAPASRAAASLSRLGL